MKKSVIMLLLVLSITTVVAETACNLEVTLLNQDPYPAVPGDYVKVVFQVDGVENPSCNKVSFELLEQYPIIFDPDQKRIYEIEAGTFSKDFSSFLIAPYKVRVDEDALNGANPLEVKYQYDYRSTANEFYQTKQFNLEVQDVKADFEIYVKDYSYATNELTLEVLNIEESDVEALTLKIPKQDNIIIKGPNRLVVGDLDSNEYTTADFEATLKDGQFIVNLIYSDAINIRREMTKTINFDSSYFIDKKADQKTISLTTYIILGTIILLIIYFSYKKFAKKKRR